MSGKKETSKFNIFSSWIIVAIIAVVALFFLNPESPIVNTQPGDAIATSTGVTNEVLKVIDGDTIKVEINNEVSTIRLIGINSPETVDPRIPVECFGKESSDKLNTLLSNQFIVLESDPTQGDVDRYGRLLRYIYLSDGTNINELMIKQGYSYEFTYDTPYKYQKLFKEAEDFARLNQIGLWSDSTCNGNL